MAETKRRARGQHAIFFAPSRDCWVGTITVGWKPDGRRDRIAVRAKTKTEVKDKLKAKRAELAAGVRTPANYTIRQCVEDWLASLTTQAQTTVMGYQIAADHMIELLGGIKLASLKAHDVQGALEKLATRWSSRTVQFKGITEKAGPGTEWSPRELRHTCVSLLSDSGVSIEKIAGVVGHASTKTTDTVYRHQIRPVIGTAAVGLDPLFPETAG